MKTCTPHTAVRMMQVNKFSLLVSHDVSYTKTCGLTYAKWRERERKVHARFALPARHRQTHMMWTLRHAMVIHGVSFLVWRETPVGNSVFNHILRQNWRISTKSQIVTNQRSDRNMTKQGCNTHSNSVFDANTTPTTRFLSSRQRCDDGWRVSHLKEGASHHHAWWLWLAGNMWRDRCWESRFPRNSSLFTVCRHDVVGKEWTACSFLTKMTQGESVSQLYSRLESTHVVDCGVLVGDEFVCVSPQLKGEDDGNGYCQRKLWKEQGMWMTDSLSSCWPSTCRVFLSYVMIEQGSCTDWDRQLTDKGAKRKEGKVNGKRKGKTGRKETLCLSHVTQREREQTAKSAAKTFSLSGPSVFGVHSLLSQNH